MMTQPLPLRDRNPVAIKRPLIWTIELSCAENRLSRVLIVGRLELARHYQRARDLSEQVEPLVTRALLKFSAEHFERGDIFTL
ncbi:hypothetical protein D3C87_1971830 [compost metagenome]